MPSGQLAGSSRLTRLGTPDASVVGASGKGPGPSIWATGWVAEPSGGCGTVGQCDGIGLSTSRGLSLSIAQ